MKKLFFVFMFLFLLLSCRRITEPLFTYYVEPNEFIVSGNLIDIGPKEVWYTFRFNKLVAIGDSVELGEYTISLEVKITPEQVEEYNIIGEGEEYIIKFYQKRFFAWKPKYYIIEIYR